MSFRRYSMNTSLKNARIFNEDSWELSEGADLTSSPYKPGQFIEQDNGGPSQTTSSYKPASVQWECDDAQFEVMPSHSKALGNNTELWTRRSKPPNTLDYYPLEENTTDSTDSASNQSRKSAKKTIFKREAPYNRLESGPSTKKSKSKQQKQEEFETDEGVLMRRQKQIDFGKNTIGYDNYVRTIARHKRTKDDPSTPNKYLKYSRRAWDGLIRQWRLQLHKYDLTSDDLHNPF